MRQKKLIHSTPAKKNNIELSQAFNSLKNLNESVHPIDSKFNDSKFNLPMHNDDIDAKSTNMNCSPNNNLNSSSELLIPKASLKHGEDVSKNTKLLVSEKKNWNHKSTTQKEKDEKEKEVVVVVGIVDDNATLFQKFVLFCVIILSFATRFFSIWSPSEVIFDEVHFGKFMAYYIRRTFYFDVHPPLGRLLFALVGWAAGFDGSFLFQKIGDDYLKEKVPYVLLRSLPALCSALVPSIAFEILRECGFSTASCAFAAALIIFDNALVAQSRLIMLDSMLILFVILSMYCWVKFSKICRQNSTFSVQWFKWLFLTGVSLGLVTGVKMVGLLTVATIGVCVLVDLWYLLDHRRTTLMTFSKHFLARAIALIILPASMYLLWFAIHFAVLSKTGPGDNFMSSEFQSTLMGNKMNAGSRYVSFGSNITIKHANTNGYLHSHVDKYPLRYEDGRVSSHGQQVTAYHHSDLNNIWRLLPADPNYWESLAEFETNYTIVKHKDIIIMQHLLTNTFLLTHDVASPLMPTNQEFTTISSEVLKTRINETLFQIHMEDAIDEEVKLSSLSPKFRLIHVATGVAMFSHPKNLPNWAFSQQEINGNKEKKDNNNHWYIEDVNPMAKENPEPKPEIKYHKEPTFIKKFLELQKKMIKHNAAITSAHPYNSHPISWPFSIRGISYWRKDPGNQVYLLGNIVSWSISTSAIIIFTIIYIFKHILIRRDYDLIGSKKAHHFIKGPANFLMLSWLLHYIPFFGMGRTLFLHHYLPAVTISFMMAGVILEIIFTIIFVKDKTPSIKVKKNNSQENESIKEGYLKIKNQSKILECMIWMVVTLITAIIVTVFIKFSPLTYGTQKLSTDEWTTLRWIQSWDIVFSKQK